MDGNMMRGEGRGEKWIKHYSSSHRILLVGEGDFSFSACLAKAFGSAKNMVATSNDSQDMLLEKHWSSEAHLEELKQRGCLVLHDIDVNDMHKRPILKTIKFDRIVFNFPHAGHFPGVCERHTHLIKMHKELVMGFFKSAVEMLSQGGEVHLSHRNDYPYNRWKVEKLAKRVGLHLIERAEFFKSDYIGYHNKRGGGIKSNRTFPLKDLFTFTFKFSLVECSHPEETGRSESDIGNLCELLPVVLRF
ncbi:uncharacterized protein At4g26485-like [Tasmannia lanceolata]|uniref:uncharacterized protein At4g26485-like n=1 Tax=Tasmannia lanceolata TaxID=3420 RepID=UPI004062EA2B